MTTSAPQSPSSSTFSRTASRSGAIGASRIRFAAPSGVRASQSRTGSWWGMREMERRDAAPVDHLPDAVANVFDHYEAHGTGILRMLSQEDRIPAIRNLTDKGRAYHHDWANRVFQQLLAGLPRASRERRLTALVLATDVLVWKQLRLDMQLRRPQAEKIVLEMIESYSRRSK
ncbi:MAG TPA: hypothetical protein VIJ39_01640 [Solirubrobacteraceae bacterium]